MTCPNCGYAPETRTRAEVWRAIAARMLGYPDAHWHGLGTALIEERVSPMEYEQIRAEWSYKYDTCDKMDASPDVRCLFACMLASIVEDEA